jgi:hypothetical protein
MQTEQVQKQEIQVLGTALHQYNIWGKFRSAFQKLTNKVDVIQLAITVEIK